MLLHQSQTTTRQYNTTLGYQTEEKTAYNSSETMYKKVEYLNQVKAGGQVTANVVSNGDLTTSESYTYDNRGRLLTHSLSTGKSTSYAYGNRKDTVTVNNRQYIKTYDAWGNVKTSTDPVSSVSYVYSSVGKPKQAASAGATFSMTYDSQGRQTTLTDPDAGTETYEYDVLDRIVKQTDAKGKVTENDYDAFGKILSTTIDGIATTYDYDSYHRLEKETREGTSVSYTYDDYNRVKTESRTIDVSNTLGFTYNYNAQGLLQSTVYPGNVTVGYAYDSYGNLASVTADNTKVWEFASNNGLRYTATLGGALTSVEERNSQGLLTSQRMLKGSTLLHNMGYTFNASTGNLTSRSGMLSQTETFGYDNVDRLTSVQHGSTTAMTLTYGANGNITSKTGIGTYSYGTKPHAVTSVSNSGSLIDSNTQSITYTPFDKAASITQNGYQLDITYGTDLQRWKSVLKNNGTVTRTTLYAGDYEKVTENGVTKQYYYLHGGNGLAALYVKQSNASDKVYYPCIDHLGSIIKLVDANGTESFKATYDAWGQQTVTTNTLNFHRGYTGHEHLAQFALINMNGRMYDPLLGRFLSPDPFVQLPDFSQNFNRYSYCLNNPLVYVDPDGEIIWVIAGAAIIGGVWNTVNNWDAICEGGFGTFVKYFGVGALAGGLGAATGVGTAALLGTSTGFAAGAIIGAASGGAGGFALGGGNALAAGGGWSKFWNGASAGFTTGLVNGAALGGITGGLDALSNGKNFWSGENIASGRSAFSFNNEPIPTATQHKATATKPDAIPLKPNPNKGLSPSAELPTRMTSDNIEYTIRTNYNPTPNIEGRGSLIPRPEIRGYDSRLNIQTDSYHNFPSSFDKLIIQEGSGYMPHGNSSMFYARGVINGIEGVYTIGINNQTGVIYHRCFYEWNTFIKNFSPYK